MLARIAILGLLLAQGAAGRQAGVASIVVEGPAGPPAAHGVTAVRAALEARRWTVKQFRTADRAEGQIAIFAKVAAGQDREPEALTIRRFVWHGKPAVEATGSDDRGLMYALLDIADRLSWPPEGADPFSAVRDTTEKPATRVRALSVYTMHPAYFQSHLYDEAYWTRYFDMLARDRFNTFVVVFGYENAGYFAPAYPYFFDVAGFPDVKVVGLTKQAQERNRQALRRMMTLAHDRGIRFEAGLWDHIYRGGVQGPAQLAEHPTEGLVWGLSAGNLGTYIPAAFAEFLKVYPEIDVVQFRMHSESGLKPAEMRDFWERMYGIMKDAPRHVTFEFRVKEFPDDLIARAVALKLNFRLETKYWAEQMGMPFAPTHVQKENQFDRRHGYADLLRYPKQYDMGYRLWNGGTSRILLWGDPDYARRFAASTHLYDGPGFEVNEPLATKMERQPPDMAPFELLNAPYRYYQYEFERYWHFYQSFGRLGYDPATPSDVWDHEFRARFGPDAGPLLEDALHRASWILPRIVAYCLPAGAFPTTRGWAERQWWGDLAAYAKSDPSDTAQFASFQEAADAALSGQAMAKVTPQETSRWFEKTAETVLADVAKAEQSPSWRQNKELVSTVTDLSILAGLARYHARRIPAAISLALFERTQDVNQLDDAIAQERYAIDAWREIVRAAGDVYADNLRMGLAEFDLTGTWKDELPKLEADLQGLERRRSAYQMAVRRPAGRFVFGREPAAEGEQRLSSRYVNSVSMPNGTYEVRVSIQGASSGYGPMWIEANGTDYTGSFTVPAGARVEKALVTSVTDGQLHVVLGADASGTWHADRLSVDRIDPVICFVPERRILPGQALEVRATVGSVSPIESVRLRFGDASRGYRAADMERLDPPRYRVRLSPDQLSPQTRYWIEATDHNGHTSATPPVSLLVSGDRDAPLISHDRVTHLAAGDSLRITARVTDPSGVKWVRVRYRGVNQHQDFRSADLLPAGDANTYSVEIPAAEIDPKWDFMYFLEAADTAGNGRIWPDLQTETPYVVVQLDRERRQARATRNR